MIALENVALQAGQKVMEIFWAESCCNGPNSVMFSFNNAEPQYLNNTSLQSAIPAVSAPKGLSLIIMGLLCVLVLNARRKAK